MRIQIIQKLIDKIRGKEARLKKTTEVVKQYRFIHIMFNDKFGKAWVDFVNKNFDTEEHLFLCKRWFDEFPFPQGKNVIEIKSLQGLDLSNAEKIFCHSFFDGELVEYLYAHQDILKQKAYWIIWGGDLYEAPRDEKNDFVRANVYAYITGGDRDIVTKVYGSGQKRFFSASYIFPVNLDMLNSTKKSQREKLVIQINNSSDVSTLEMLDVLAKFKDENIIIKTILSYGNLEFKDEIIKKGKRVFRDKFEYLDKILPPDKYAQHLANIDILILNQNRQQGVGNTQSSLYLGNKVFIRSDVTTYKDFNSCGIKIYDSKEIINLDFNEFINYPEKEANKQIVKNFIDETILQISWKQIFES